MVIKVITHPVTRSEYMQIDFDKISFDSLLTIVLIVVFIIQTAYLIRQTNFGVRSSQANLVETWKKEFEKINLNSLMPNPSNMPDENEFQKLVNVLYRMQPLFREKLLKPYDFANVFIALYLATSSEGFRKTTTFRENYLQLQNIFSIFDKDIGVIMYIIGIAPTSMYEGILQQISFVKKYGLTKNLVSNWRYIHGGIKLMAWLDCKVKRSSFFKLDPPL